MWQSILMMGGLGVVIGTALVIASKAFYVYEDPKVAAINDALPGANCGGCGYPGCSANAEAIAEGKQDVNSCVAAGDDVAMAIAAIMGVSLSEKEPEFAAPGCHYGTQDADVNFEYMGIHDCRAAVMLMGGMKICRVGCLGLGTCTTACKFGALTMGEDNLPKVDQEKCTGCGACESICPKNIIRVSSVRRRIMHELTLDECTTPCQRACPSGINIKDYIRLIREEDYHGALQVIKERMPLPTVISRICPALCESDCRRILKDESVAINHLKRFVCDYEMNQDKRIQPYCAPSSGKKVAVVGGGVEGLAAGFFSARLGHGAAVYEAGDVFGGLLRKAIARDRLSMDILDWDIQGIADLGVKLKPGMKAGVDFTIPGLLKEGYDAVYMATGGWDSRLANNDIGSAANNIPGTWLLLDLLRSKSDKNIKVDVNDVAVIAGGGMRLTQAAAILKDQGAKKVIVMSRKPADDAVGKALTEAGVEFLSNTAITRVMGTNELLTGIEYIELDTGLKHVIDTNTLIIGAGRFPELVFVPVKEGDEEETVSQEEVAENTPLIWQGIELQKKPDIGMELGLLSRQDVISEYPAAVAAINGGRRGATLMHHLIYGLELPENDRLLTQNSPVQDVVSISRVAPSARNILEITAPGSSLKSGFSTGFSVEQAANEAQRCLQCGLICYEKNKCTSA